jgi:hypothetical protein
MQRARDSVEKRAKEAVEQARRAIAQSPGRNEIRDSTGNGLDSQESERRVNWV